MYRLVQLAAALGYMAFGAWGLFLSVRILLEVAGTAVAILGFLLFPVSLAVAPWIGLFAQGSWTALLVVYGGGLAAGLLHAVGNALRRGSRSNGDAS